MLFFNAFSIPTFAEDAQYKICIAFETETAKIDGAVFRIAKVAERSEEDGKYWDFLPEAHAGSYTMQDAFTKTEEVSLYLAEHSDDLPCVQVVTGINGVITTGLLDPGMYLIWQTEANNTAVDYEISVPFLIDLTAENEDIGADHILTVYPKTSKIITDGGVDIYVTEAPQNTPLGGAVISLYNAATNELIQRYTMDESGTFEIRNIALGSYYFVEEKAPEGFERYTEQIPFELTYNTPYVRLHIEHKRAVLPTADPATPSPTAKPTSKPTKSPAKKTETPETTPTPSVTPTNAPTATPTNTPDAITKVTVESGERRAVYTDPLSRIDTIASSDGGKFIKIPFNGTEDVTITDQVTIYQCGKPGMEYVMTGILVDGQTGEFLTDKNGAYITGNTTFLNAETTSCTVIFHADSSCFSLNQSVVVYEQMLDLQGNVIASHADLDDEDQTLYVKGYDKVQTGMFPLFSMRRMD